MEKYPEAATERFDNANFHIKYCLSIIKKYIAGDVLEVGAGCGSFTRNYYNKKIKNVVLTETDEKNIYTLKNKFRNFKNFEVLNLSVDKINKKFNSILYFHVLEHIKDDLEEIKKAKSKLNSGGHLVFIVPASKRIYGNLDKAVGHFRRYEKEFFKKDLLDLELLNLKHLDSIGYVLYYLNKIFFSKETFPSNFKIFLWDKFFTPLTVIIDFIINYSFGKCIIAVYKKK